MVKTILILEKSIKIKSKFEFLIIKIVLNLSLSIFFGETFITNFLEFETKILLIIPILLPPY